MRMNKNYDNFYISKKTRLSQAMTNYYNYSLDDSQLKRREYNIFKNTNIIGGVDPKTHNNNLEFLIVPNENDENYDNKDDKDRDVILEKDDE